MSDWQQFDAELENWARAGEPATLWWRDDDAAADSSQLKQLVSIADKNRIPLHLAVIPARLEDTAAQVINASAYTRVLQHGFAHIDHAPKGNGSWELGDHRPVEQVLDELRRGAQILQSAFGDKFLAVQVPPWTRISPAVAARLPEAGFSVLSLEGLRRETNFDSYVKVINPHCDPIRWKDNARFKGDKWVLDSLAAHLKNRRQPGADRTEPTGLCTHHMDHDDALWTFLEKFADHTSALPHLRWLSLDEAIK